MPARRALLLAIAALPLGAGVAGLAGCGWTPLYADRPAGPADAALRAIHVAPIAERIGQRLELALRQSFNPGGRSTPQRYLLRTTLVVSRADIGVITQGVGTRARLDVFATYVLSDIKTGTQLFTGHSHAVESFDIEANEYSDVVAEDDTRTRDVEELRNDIVAQLTLFMQRQAAAGKT